ncbi:MAG: hypothetical protein PVJ86_00545 [Phycisphaerales bacterium]|jgi:SAM-dependent methyltransferase
MPKSRRQIFEDAKGIKLDVGCGIFKQKGCVGIDIVKHPNVDIVHDIQKFPWPVPKDICTFILMSHIWEHIEPKYRFQLMDECWRICRHDGQLLIACPYAGSPLEAAHPAHYMCPNEATFQFFDPEYQLWHSCSYKKPLPWKIIQWYANLAGCLEIALEPRKHPNGRPHKLPDKPTQYGAVQLVERKRADEVKMPKKKQNKGVNK